MFLQGANWEARGGNPNAEFVFAIEPGETEADAVKRLVASAALLCRGDESMSLPGWVCPADVFADRVVNAFDITAVLWGFGTAVSDRYELPTADTNRDGVVDGLDLAVVLNSWGACGP